MRKSALPVVAALLIVVMAASHRSASAGSSKARVFLAGSGNPAHLTMLLEDLTDLLREKKVAAKVLTSTPKARDEHLEALAAKGGEFLLYLRADIGEMMGRSTLTIQCLKADGSKLWEDQIPARLFNMTPDGDARDILVKAKKKLAGRVGGVGLPIGPK